MMMSKRKNHNIEDEIDHNTYVKSKAYEIFNQSMNTSLGPSPV